MISFLGGIVGPKTVKPLLIVLGVILIVSALGVARCVWKGEAARQAQQTTRSGEALTEAAEGAVEAITNAQGREVAIDTLVAGAALEIDAAGTPQEKRAAAINAVCQLPEYAGDPQCRRK